MSEVPLPLPALEKPTEPFESEQARADEESPIEGGNIVAPEHVVDGEPSASPSMTREGFAVSPRLPSTLVNIDDLPEDLAATLRPMDINGDGKITLTELVHGAITQHEQRKKVIYFRRLVLGFILVWILTMGAFTGLVFGVIQLSKDTSVSDGSNGKKGAALVTADHEHIVQTASSDFFVAGDGSAYVRHITSQSYEDLEGTSSGEDAQYNVMKTSQAQANITFSSYIPDEVLLELKSISIRSATGAHISLQVLGVLRMPAEGYATVGAVTIITHIGRIVIDGTAVSFYDDTDVAIFESAGFIINGGSTVGGRRLLDGIQALFGIFNAVASLKDWKNTNVTYANIAPPKLPANFVMHSRRFAPCIAHPNEDGSVVTYPDYLGGTLPSEPGIDYCDLLGIDDKFLAMTHVNTTTVMQRFIETQYVIHRFGSDFLRVEYVHPLHPNVTFVEVLDNSDPENPVQFHYNVDTETKGLVTTVVSSELEIVEFKGPIYYYNSSYVAAQNLVDQALSSPFDYLGTTEYEGKEVRIWAMHLMDNTVHAYWYDSVDTQQVQRIDYGDFGMLDVVGLTSINDTDAAAMSFLFAQPIANLTEVVTGATDYLPFQVGISPYEPFVVDYSNKLAAQSSDSSEQRFSTQTVTSSGEKLLVAPKHLLIENAEARRRRHVPSTEQAPASRRDAYLQQAAELKLAHGEEDAVEQVMEMDNSEPDLSAEEVALLERAAVEAQEQAAIDEDRPHTAEEAAAPIIRALPAHLLNSTVVINRNSVGKVLQSVDRSCPAGWVAYLDTCFYFYSSSYKGTWDTCDSLCKSNTPGSQMLCIQDSAQNNFLTASAKSRGISRLWIGMQRDSSGKLQWGSSCNSYYYNWDSSMEGVNKYVASKTDSDGKWFDATPQAYFCACQNTFSAPSVRPTAQPSSTRAPLNRPTAPPTMLVTTSRPSSAPNTRPINLPRRVIPTDISAIANSIIRFMGCKEDNKCDNYFLWYDTIDAPFFPVLTASGNDKFPCVYSSGMDVPVPVPVVPVIEIGVEAGLEIAFCNDLSGLDYVYGSIGVSVGITGLADLPTPFGAVFSYQVANVGIGFTFYVSEQWCSVQNGKATYSSNEAYGLLRHVANTAKGPQICRCLERGQSYPGLMFGVGGPDIPGAIMATFPPFIPLAPFLIFTRITNSALLENFPDVCSLAISRSSMTIDLVIDLAFYSYSVNVFSYQMSMAHKSGAAAFIGAMMDKPRGLDAFLDAKGFSDRYLEGPFSKAGDKMKKILDANAAVWIAVVQLGGELANSAKNYFNKGVAEGKILASAAGSLYRLFKPPAVVVYGCFDPHISEPECARKIKLFGKRRCIAWHMPKISCGSTSKCIKYC